MNESVSAEVLISTPALQKTYLPHDREYNDDWTPIALAIQRGRDHGIPAYHKAVNLCEARLGLDKGKQITFDHIQQLTGFSLDERRKLEQLYQNAADIDLLAGVLSERPALGTVFGPTLSCMLALQFANLRNGDRFWYENDIPPSSLSLDQLQAIRRSTLAGLLCATGGVKETQPKAFIREDPYLNFRQTCEQIPGLDLSAWKSDEESLDVETSEELAEVATTVAPLFDDLDPKLIRAAMDRARESLTERRRFEYEAWLERKLI